VTVSFNNKPPTPKRLILSLLSAPDLPEVSVRQCTRWGELFDIDAAAMRVALGRLVKAGLLRSVRRGVYAIGPRGASLSATARTWRDVEARLAPWNGDWLLVHTAHLGRSNRSALRERERALRLEGLRSPCTGLWCRPANYREPLSDTRERLCELGLDEAAPVMRAGEIAGAPPLSLWPCRDLERAYGRSVQRLRDSARRLPALSPEAAARESLLLGEAVIRQINADPLLPDELVDGAARRELIAAMDAYDALGRSIWDQLAADP
jgi:phenylacetic acid degradation operon negative regulatory protein